MVCQVIFINGPPGSGKDTLGQHLLKKLPGFETAKFSRELKERTHALYGRPELPHDYFEEVKDKPSLLFRGFTPRQVYIRVSERYFKPIHGEQIFGELLIEQLDRRFATARGFIITDSGFRAEAAPVIQRFGDKNCVLVRIKDRGSFANDSRAFLDLPVFTIDVRNNRGKADFLHEVTVALSERLQVFLDSGEDILSQRISL